MEFYDDKTQNKETGTVWQRWYFTLSSNNLKRSYYGKFFDDI